MMEFSIFSNYEKRKEKGDVFTKKRPKKQSYVILNRQVQIVEIVFKFFLVTDANLAQERDIRKCIKTRASSTSSSLRRSSI